MRRLARLLPYIALVLVASIVVAFLWRAGPLRRQLRATITEQLKRQTNRDVAVGDVGISPTGQVVIRDLTIRNKDGSVLLIAPEAAVRLGRPLSLLSPSTAAGSLRAITLRKPEITVIRDVSRRWNIEDLLQRKPEAPSKFAGDVIIDGGRITVVDQARGASTTIEDVDLNVQQPGPGQIRFTFHARGAEDSFDSLDASGTSDSNARTTDVSGKISDMDMGYAFARLPELKFMAISAGRANVTGQLKLTPQTPQTLGAGASVEAEVTRAEISFPWLKRPVKDVKGTVRFADGDIHLDGVAGTVSGAPVEASGTVSRIQSPQLDITFKTWGLRLPQLKQLMPKLLAPVTLALPSPLTIDGHATGTAADPVVRGTGRVKVIKFRLLPWHDAVADFTYTKGKLRIENLHAHGSPRKLSADITIQWQPGAPTRTTARFELANVPVRDLMKMIGIEGLAFEGTASFTGTASLAAPQSVSGHFVVKNAATRGLRLGDVSGDLEYSDHSAIIRRGRIDGDLGRGKFAASIIFPDKYSLDADFADFDLSALAGVIGASQLTGRFPLTIRAAGPIRGTRSSGSIELGPGQAQGRAFQFVRANFDLTLRRLKLANVTGRLHRGTAAGSLEIGEWQRLAQRAPIAGRFTFDDVALGDWIPLQYSVFLTSGSASGSAELSGTVSDPVLVLDADSISATAAGLTLQNGTARVRYQAGALVVEKLDAEESLTRLRVTAETTPTGTVYSVTGDQIEVRDLAAQIATRYDAAKLSERYGLDVAGEASVRARMWGDVRAPKADFSISADEVTINGLTFNDIALSGAYSDGILRIAAPPSGAATLWQSSSSITIAGTVGLQSGQSAELTVDLGNVDLLTIQSLVDRAAYRLALGGVELTRLSPYFMIPRPFGGTVTAHAWITGAIRQPEVTASLTIKGLSFGDRSVEKIEGRVGASLRLEGHTAAALQTVKLETLRATEGPAYASLTGDVSPGASMSLKLESGNIDVSLLRPWLQYVVDLDGLALEGKATVNFDVSGTTDNPDLLGDISVDDLTLGPLQFENARAYPIRLRNGVVTVESLTFSDFPMVATGTAQIPLDRALDRSSADLKIEHGRFAPVEGLPPLLEFDANLYLRGNKLFLSKEPPETGMPPRDGLRETPATGKLAIQGTAELTHLSPRDWQQNSFDMTADLNGLELDIPGMVQGRLTGRLILFANAPVTDRLVLATPGLVSWAAVAAEPLDQGSSRPVSIQMRDVSILDAVAEIRRASGASITVGGGLAGMVSLARDGATVDRLLEDIYDQTGAFWWRSQGGDYYIAAGPPLDSQPIVLSQSTLVVPRALPTAGASLPFALDARVRLVVGDGVEFRYGAGSRPTRVKVDPGSYLYIGGPLTPAGVILDGQARSREGTLSFPNGTLTLRSGVATVTLSHRQETRRIAPPSRGWAEAARPDGGPARVPHVWVSADADGRIGDYFVSLNPIGQVYPPPPETGLPGTPGARLGYSLNAVSIPPLDEAYIMALLAGPILSPAIGTESQDIARLLSYPGSPSTVGNEITGFALPTLGSLSPASPQLSLAVPFQGPVRLRIGERLFRRVLISYLSPLSGAESRAVTITYEVTPRWSLGWNFNPIDRARWEAQAFFPF